MSGVKQYDRTELLDRDREVMEVVLRPELQLAITNAGDRIGRDRTLEEHPTARLWDLPLRDRMLLPEELPLRPLALVLAGRL